MLVTHADWLRHCFARVQAAKPFRIDAIVVMPDHLHCIWTLPEGDADFSSRWQAIKAHFSRDIPPDERLSVRRQAKGERGIWQRRFWEHAIRDERDFERHVDYIHYNPVKHGHVSRAADWPLSSFHRYVARGLYELDWGAAEEVRALELE